MKCFVLYALDMKVDAVILQWLQSHLQCTGMWSQAHAVDAVSHKVDAVYCDGECTAHEIGCSDVAVVAVLPELYRMWMQWSCSGCSVPQVDAL